MFGEIMQGSPEAIRFKSFEDRMPRRMISLYSEVPYRWLIEQKTTHCLFLSDDNHMAPRFVDIITAMVTAQPTVPIGLGSLHPRGKQVRDQGGHWYRCLAWMAGPAMLLPRSLLVDHLRWRDDQPLSYIRDKGDDQVLNEYLYRAGIDSWHPIPAPIDHDAALPTAQDGHVETVEKYRRPTVTWRDGYDIAELCKVETWKTEGEPPFFKVPAEEERLGIKPYEEP